MGHPVLTGQMLYKAVDFIACRQQAPQLPNLYLSLTDNHACTPSASFLHPGCPFCCQTNSTKALKGIFYVVKWNVITCVISITLSVWFIVNCLCYANLLLLRQIWLLFHFGICFWVIVTLAIKSAIVWVQFVTFWDKGLVCGVIHHNGSQPFLLYELFCDVLEYHALSKIVSVKRCILNKLEFIQWNITLFVIKGGIVR